ncbi:MAG: hypothetical protein ACYDHY_17475 [Acidiferrobacterales bacterium]
MPVSGTWTSPSSLDRTTGQTLPSATYEDVLGDLLYLYDVLTAVTALAVHLTSSLTVDGAVSAGSLTVGGAALRRTTYGTSYIANPGIASGGSALYAVTLTDYVTPLAVGVTLDTGGYAVDLVAYGDGSASGSVTVLIVNWGASTVTTPVTIHVLADY